jgi:hypothetical protein
MIVDSSALPEQLVDDALSSAFDSAGQRCSALRVLFLQEDVAESMIDMLLGATRELAIGDPLDYATDVGPVIDAEAKAALEQHKARMRHEGRELLDLPLPPLCAHGTYVSPAISPSLACCCPARCSGRLACVITLAIGLAKCARRWCHGLWLTLRPHPRAGDRGLRGGTGEGRNLYEPQPDRRRWRAAWRRGSPEPPKTEGRII